MQHSGFFRGTDYGTSMCWLVRTSKDLGGRTPLASRCISLSWLFFHDGTLSLSERRLERRKKEVNEN